MIYLVIRLNKRCEEGIWLKEIEKDIIKIIPDISPEQLDNIMDLVWNVANEYASYVEKEAVSSAMSSLARFGK